MGRFRWIATAWLGLCLAGAGMGTAQAEVRYELTGPNGVRLSLSAINQKRENNTLVLYTPEYGGSTRTNAYGVEVIATPMPGSTSRYQVSQMSSIWTCQAQKQLAQCGNAAIPTGGIVLSAAGEKRDALVKTFLPGTEFSLDTFLTFESYLPVDGINPSPETNPRGKGFPGYRGGNQLLMYTADYGQPTTGTNEFGNEVTVVNHRVVISEGANSQIPTEPGGFVLSGHGKAREWLLQNAPIGSRIDVMDGRVISLVDRDTYLYQLDQLAQKIQSLGNKTLATGFKQQIEDLRFKAISQTDEEISHQAIAMRSKITPQLWASYPKVPASAPRAIWHRPSEASLKEVRQSLDLIQQAGVNTIFLETYLHGDPIFPSQTFDAHHIPQKPVFSVADAPSNDVLKLWLDEAHKRGLKVHVWFQTFYAGNKQYDGSMGSILATYPDWANIQRSSLDLPELPPSTLEPGAYFLDPTNPQAQRFLLSLIDEIVTRYPVDGFQLDYIRYPAAFPSDRLSSMPSTWGYTPYARQTFQAQTGADPAMLSPATDPELWAQWNQFKTAQVDSFVQQAHDLIKRRKPQMPLSVAVFPKDAESLSRKHQNWVVWAQKGWVDFLAPMTLTSSLETIEADTKNVHDKTGLPVVTGIFGPFNGNSATDVVDQVWSAFSSGATGIALFDTAHFTQPMAEALHAGIFKDPPQR